MSQLKEHRPDYTLVFSDLNKLPAPDLLDVVPEKALDRRMVKKGNAAIVQVLVKWTNFPDDSATWEDWEVLKTSFWRSLIGDNQGLLGEVLSRRRTLLSVDDATTWAIGELSGDSAVWACVPPGRYGDDECACVAT